MMGHNLGIQGKLIAFTTSVVLTVAFVFAWHTISFLHESALMWKAVAGAALLAGGSTALAVCVSVFLARSFTRPILELAALTRQIGRPGTRARVASGRRDKIGVLSRAFAELIDALDERTSDVWAPHQVLRGPIDAHLWREEEPQETRRIEALGRLADGMAHSYNNLLTIIAGYSQLLLMRADTDDLVAESVREIKQAADRAASLTRQLQVFSYGQILEPELQDQSAVMTESDQRGTRESRRTRGARRG